VIKARIKGRSLWGEVTEVKDGIVYFSPISSGAGGGTPARARSSVTGTRRDDAPAAARMTMGARPSRASSSRCRGPTGNRSRREVDARHVA
jgi:hypothetical protein